MSDDSAILEAMRLHLEKLRRETDDMMSRHRTESHPDGDGTGHTHPPYPHEHFASETFAVRDHTHEGIAAAIVAAEAAEEAAAEAAESVEEHAEHIEDEEAEETTEEPTEETVADQAPVLETRPDSTHWLDRPVFGGASST